MSAVLQETEEVVELGPEHRLIFDLITEIKKDSADDRKIIHDDIKKINEKLDTHIGYHIGRDKLEKSTVLEIVKSIVSLFKEQPLILVIIAAVVLLISADTLHEISGWFV